MGEHGKHGSLVKSGIFAICSLLATPADACRLALILAMDVSSSVDAAEDLLQRGGLAAALESPEVQEAFFTSADPVALHVFEWSGRSHQTTLIDWTLIVAPADLNKVVASLRNSTRSASGLPTAIGQALGYASVQLSRAPDCRYETIDMAGDGPNNSGFGPLSVYATFPFDDVTVNGLVITGSDDAARAYYETQVIRGFGAFVEVAEGYADFEDTMRRKLLRELSAQVIGRLSLPDMADG